ncbi:carboxyltransferase domain-containing protein [uncultured Boseongicola sp.]|uniref:5-oxoprolinase subunit B family protein n=1 Tax=uncultured Boseongicola sp. TaxID=1648499 RepID=UPI003412CA50
MTRADSPDMSAFPRIVDVGLCGMLVTFSDVLTDGANSAALAFRAAVEALGLDGVSETSTSLTSTFVTYDPLLLARDALRARLQELTEDRVWSAAPLPTNRVLWTIPAVFGGEEAGPQLEEAARLAGVSPDVAVAELCAKPLRVMTLGFAPGQPYLGSLPKNWDIPRQSGLTKRVPIGAITVAIRQIVLFSTSTPTGWRQVGKCGFHAFRPNAPEPFALKPGDEIRFRSVSAQDFANLQAGDQSGDGGAIREGLG